MNSKKIFTISAKQTPVVPVKYFSSYSRHDIVQELLNKRNVGIELGVAKGIFSERMIRSERFTRFFGVDCYSDLHDSTEYIHALNRIGLEQSSYSLLRLDFEDALKLFPDDYFDFVYVDGYAHTGEEGGATLVQWFKKLKRGGILAGDDYHPDWPLVVWAVNNIAKQINATVCVASKIEDADYCRYPTWFLKKSQSIDLIVDSELYSLGLREKKRIARLREPLHYRNFFTKIFERFFR